MNEPQVSWKAIERGAVVVASDGQEAARVVEVAGDPDADIFDGLVVVAGTLAARRYLPSERVSAIWPRRVEVDADADELGALPPYEEPVVERLARPGLVSRIRRFFRG
ncbi:MAG TPA: hypothetical protein VH650_13495 [Gaiellaceae bacterium]